MCDLNWCPVCEKAISCESDSLYCSVNCFLLDTKSQPNSNKFLSFLRPKSLLRKKKQENSCIPQLSKSIYTSSSLSTRSPLDSYYGEAVNDDLEMPECCDYCDTIKNVQEKKKPSLLDDKLYQISSSPFYIPIS